MSAFWDNKKVLVTGCTGFLGYWLAEHLLDQGAELTGLVKEINPQSNYCRYNLNQRIHTVKGGLEDYSLLEQIIKENAIDTVFHLAAQAQIGTCSLSPLSTFETNIRGTWNVLEACRKNSGTVKRVVVASSDKAYGSQEKLPYSEEAPLKGAYPYDVSKSCADLIAFAYFNTYQLPVCITRCGNIYGPGDLNVNRLIPGTIRSVLLNEPIIIRSNGLLKRDYLYVKDAVSAYMVLAETMQELNLAGEAFNFGSGLLISVKDMVNTILRLMEKKDYPINILKEFRGEIKDQYMSTQKAHRILGWKSRYSVEVALRETIDSYDDYFDLK